MSRKIFISYRRDDARADARSIYQHLLRAFGRRRLFMDVDTIQRGKNFEQVLQEALSDTSVMLVVMGRSWLDISDGQGNRRLDDAKDYVRLEIATALKSGIPVIPVRIDNTPLPGVDALPLDIRGLVKQQSVNLTHESFGRDIVGLEQDIRALLPKTHSRLLVAGAAVGLLSILGVLVNAAGWLSQYQAGAVRSVPVGGSATTNIPETLPATNQKVQSDFGAREAAEQKRLEAAEVARVEEQRLKAVEDERRAEQDRQQELLKAQEQMREANEKRAAAEKERDEAARAFEEQRRIASSASEKRTPVQSSKVVQYVIVNSPVYARGDTVKIKISAASRFVKAFAVFPIGPRERSKVEANYSISEGGLHIPFKIPLDAKPGYYEVPVYIQEIQSKLEEKHVVEFDIR